jgi:hypothetical protein
MVNFYWRQTIVGLLRHAGDEVPSLAWRCARASKELDHTLTSPWLEEAFALFQRAATLSHDPVFVTGAYYTMRALDEVQLWERQAGGPVELVITASGEEYVLPRDSRTHQEEGSSAIGEDHAVPDSLSEDDQPTHDAQQGIIELFDRIRHGATLEEALALFPQIGDEHSPD